MNTDFLKDGKVDSWFSKSVAEGLQSLSLQGNQGEKLDFKGEENKSWTNLSSPSRRLTDNFYAYM